MLLTDFIEVLQKHVDRHEKHLRYYEGVDMLGPASIYIDIFGDNGYKGYSSEIITFIDETNGNIVISAFESDQTTKGPHAPLHS